MQESIFMGVAAVLFFGITAQWLAWKMKLPAILLLLFAGIMAGPVTGYIDPDKLLGDLLLPMVSISVALILFEGGLSLDIKELKGFGKVVLSLVTVGVFITWGVSYLAGVYILGLDKPIAVLLGAVLVVTGPTVIIPLLRHIRPVGHLSSILKWEGIVIDPVGAMLALLVFEAVLTIQESGAREAANAAMHAVGSIMVIGTLFGLIGAFVMVMLLKKFLIPDYLQNPFTFMAVVLVFTLSDHYQHESGLFAVTLMGVLLANQKQASIKHIIEFKENIRVLLISSLFIILAARLDPKDFTGLNIDTAFFILVLIFIARPLSVYFSTIGSGLKFKERAFIMAMAPRGIVAAAISAVFSLRLVEAGYSNAEAMVPLTFAVIVATVAVYGLGSSYMASLMGLSRSNPQGVVIAGAHKWARDIAECLKKEGIDTLLADRNWGNVTEARLMGLRAYYGSIVGERFSHDADLSGMGRFLALTYNDDVNSLAAVHMAHFFEKMELYQLPPASKEKTSQELKGRVAFGEDVTFSFLNEKFRQGYIVKSNLLTEEFGAEKLMAMYADGPPPIFLFLINDKKELSVYTADKELHPKEGCKVISLVKPKADKNGDE